MAMPKTWDIFCRVVDNYGDAGVCWRLARRLARKGGVVRLWIDDLPTLERLHSGVRSAAIQSVEGIEIRALRDELLATPPAEVVIEAFGCGLPEAYAVAMANARPACLWIVLEYLSAESWVAAHHGLPSPPPRLNLRRFFFFPGFAAGTGGVLREPDLFIRRDAFGEAGQRRFWTSAGHDMPAANATTVSLFAYETAPVTELLEAWERSSIPIVAAVPEGPLLAAVLRYFGVSTPPPRGVIERAALQVRAIPFVPQARYDELLWSCDVNFVRGEDSFVRAQWAGRPFVWQIYPQEDGSHQPKLEAFLDRYCEAAPAEIRRAARSLMMSWNGAACGYSVASAWAAFHACRGDLGRHTRSWAERVGAVGDLADNLAAFCEDKLKYPF
jgi:uncharacterized repeat protein (TIGR03837 family)